MDRIVIAGGGLAATRTCEQLRSKGYAGELIMLGSERYAPYDRPPLTKAVLAGEHDTTLRTDFDALSVDVRLGTSATGLDPQARIVQTTGGELAYDALVIATGAFPARLPGSGRQFTVRTCEDAAALRAELRPGRRVVLAGASWISAEIATAALKQGCSVTCVEQGRAPFELALGSEIAELLRPWWSEVDLRLGVEVEEITEHGVHLLGGEHLDADVVVTGIGVRPESSWLEGSGVALERGVLVDEHLRTSQPGVHALGDVAARWSPRWNARLRVEHWDDARAAAETVAGTVLAGPSEELPVHDPVPYFWSDQFGHKLQYVGHHTPTDTVLVRGDDTEKWAAAWLDTDGKLTAHLSIDQPRRMIEARKAIDAGTVPDGIPIDSTIIR
ncbi:NAD(P)/FAD-dependent oxidoreductase [Haloactinomyces albus]|uniref:NADPH-dependent 2,4-dienoyl-CoA reductase/sulfur reductase-like enzyme n=1 Tax=Haloactinomyces albus TaxID=1352928 RepID=A0AAE3ZHX8_9ACTN|nr:FAD-dependent oxidoreductase [Haloactinomyces albus]MDR7303923.1 NADPH-dependent 2,4-dienoyl-CoA reductase/sulfur reductase-like enzyme [Haloactinomyces albus]